MLRVTFPVFVAADPRTALTTTPTTPRASAYKHLLARP